MHILIAFFENTNIKQMNKFIFIALCFILVTFTACEKEKVTTPATVTFNVTTPYEDQEYNLGDTVRLYATVSSTTAVQHYRIVYRYLTGGQVKYNFKFVDSKDFIIDNYWVNTLANGGDMMIEITAELDTYGKDVRKKVIHYKCKFP